MGKKTESDRFFFGAPLIRRIFRQRPNRQVATSTAVAAARLPAAFPAFTAPASPTAEPSKSFRHTWFRWFLFPWKRGATRYVPFEKRISISFRYEGTFTILLNRFKYILVEFGWIHNHVTCFIINEIFKTNPYVIVTFIRLAWFAPYLNDRMINFFFQFSPTFTQPQLQVSIIFQISKQPSLLWFARMIFIKAIMK